MLAAALMPDLDCVNCSAAQQFERGCHETSPLGKWVKLGGEELDRCPRRPILEDPEFFRLAFECYDAYIKGHLPDEGAFGSQAHKFTRVVSIMGSALDAARAEQAKEAERRAAVKARSRR